MAAPDGWRERMVGAAGTRLFLREAGDGPPVVLLHGFPQTGACWRAVAPALVAGGHRVLIPDLPGYGRSEVPLGYDAATLSQTLAALLRHIGAVPASVVGHDWGGMLAYRLASHHAELLERVAVINSPYRRLDLRRGWHMVALNLPVLPEAAFLLAGDRLIEWMLKAASAQRDVFTPETTAPYREALRGLARQRAAFAYYRTVTRRRLAGALSPRTGDGAPRRIEIPAMVVWGMKDPALPASLLDGIARDIPHARIERIPDAGHFVPEERPEQLAALLLDFLDA